MKRFLKVFERFFACYIESMGISLLVCILLNIPMKFIVKNYSDLTNFIIGIVGAIVSMFVLGLIDGYKWKEFELNLLLLSSIAFLIVLVAVISIIGHAIYMSGPTDYLVFYIHEINPSLINGKVMLNKYCIVLMVCAYIVLYAPIILIAENLGVKIRKKQFANYKNKSQKN